MAGGGGGGGGGGGPTLLISCNTANIFSFVVVYCCIFCGFEYFDCGHGNVARAVDSQGRCRAFRAAF